MIKGPVGSTGDSRSAGGRGKCKYGDVGPDV